MKLLEQLENWGYQANEVVKKATTCKHQNSEGYVVGMIPSDDLDIKIGRRCFKRHLSCEVIDYVNSFSPKFISITFIRPL